MELWVRGKVNAACCLATPDFTLVLACDSEIVNMILGCVNVDNHK